MQVLRKSTTAVVTVGPVLDTSGIPVTTAVISDFNINKNSVTSVLVIPASVSHSHNGHYFVSLTTSNSDTEGRLEITSGNPSHAMPPARFQVVSQFVYDIMYQAGALGPPTVDDIRTELSPELNRIDVDVSSRLAADSLPLAIPQDATIQTGDSCGFNFSAFYGETRINSISLFNSDGTPYVLSGLTLKVCIENTNKTDLEVIEHPDIIISGNIVSFQTEVANQYIGQHVWSIRSIPNNLVLAQGNYNVRKAALASS